MPDLLESPCHTCKISSPYCDEHCRALADHFNAVGEAEEAEDV